jgi:hypothetical protein
MAKMLENLDWRCKWVSHLGCVKGCLDYLGIDASDAWVYGASGHAFIINMHEEMCPSSPTAWNTQRMLELISNLGCKLKGVCAHKSQENFTGKQEHAWELVKSAIDSDYPCYGWELDIPEYFVVYGYDENNYYFKGPQTNDPTTSETKPKPWQELGKTDIGMIEMYAVKPAQAKNDSTLVKEALTFAIEHAENPAKWTFPKYMTGPQAYDNWIKALGSETANGFGAAYNAEVWHECRHLAVEFLKEAKERLANPKLTALFDEACAHYEVVRDKLKEITGLLPFLSFDPAHIKDASRREKVAAALREAREAEAKGLASLEKIVAAV